MDSQEINLRDLENQHYHALLKKTHVPEDFIKTFLPNINAISSGIFKRTKLPPGIEFGDLVSWGIEGLIKAKKKFKDTGKSKFSTYAFYRIRGEILDTLRKEWHYRSPKEYKKHRVEIQKKMADFIQGMCMLDEKDSDPSQPKDPVQKVAEPASLVYLMSIDNLEVESSQTGTRNPEIEMLDEDMTDEYNLITKAIGTLSSDEQQIVDLFYNHGYRQNQIAKKLNFSTSKVCRLHMKLLVKLKKSLNNKD